MFREKYPNKKAYSWFAKGKPQGSDYLRVDYALLERSLGGNVVDIIPGRRTKRAQRLCAVLACDEGYGFIEGSTTRRTDHGGYYETSTA